MKSWNPEPKIIEIVNRTMRGTIYNIVLPELDNACFVGFVEPGESYIFMSELKYDFDKSLKTIKAKFRTYSNGRRCYEKITAGMDKIPYSFLFKAMTPMKGRELINDPFVQAAIRLRKQDN